MSHIFDDSKHAIDVIAALMNIATAAQHGLKGLDRDGLGTANWQPLAEAVQHWETLTDQHNPRQYHPR